MTNQKGKGRATYEPFMEPARVTEWTGFDRFGDLDIATKISWPSSSTYASTYGSTDGRLNANGSTKRCESYIDGETHWNLDCDVFVPRAESSRSARSPADSFSSQKSTSFGSSRNRSARRDDEPTDHLDAYGTSRSACRCLGEPWYLPVDPDASGRSATTCRRPDSLARLNEMLGKVGVWDSAATAANASTHNADVGILINNKAVPVKKTAASSHGWEGTHQQQGSASRDRRELIDATNNIENNNGFLSRDVYGAQRGNTGHRFSHSTLDKDAHRSHIFPMAPQSHDFDFDFDRQHNFFPMHWQSHMESRQQHNFSILSRPDAYSIKSTGLNDDNYCLSTSTVQGQDQGQGQGGLFEPTSPDNHVPSRSNNNNNNNNDSEQQRSPTDASTVPSQGSNNDNDSWVEQRSHVDATTVHSQGGSNNDNDSERQRSHADPTTVHSQEGSNNDNDFERQRSHADPTTVHSQGGSNNDNDSGFGQRSHVDATTVHSQGGINNDNDSGVGQRVENAVENADGSDSRGEEESPPKEKPFETRPSRRINCFGDLRFGKMLQRKEIVKSRSTNKEMDEINTRCLSPEDIRDAFTSLKKNKNAVTMWDIIQHLSTSLDIPKEDMRLEFRNRYFRFNEQQILKIHEFPVENPTTMIVRNIPRGLGRNQLEKQLEETGFPCGLAYNFLYLPHSVHNRRNLGYAFINFLTSELASDFTKKWDKQKAKDSRPKSRPLKVSVSEMQGKDANLNLVLRNKAYKLTGPELQPIVSGPDGARIVVSRLYFEQMKTAGGPPEDIVRPASNFPKNKKSSGSRDSYDEDDSESCVSI